jgi:Fe(3+) dicitrate transport protein
MNVKLYITVAGMMWCSAASAQKTDTVSLNAVQVKGYKTINGIGHMNEYSGEVIYSGKKNEVLVIDSLDANKAVNNTRQIIGRIPGVNIIETETGGFTANGIGFRGVNPYQSIAMNTRQNGYNISADIFGYNEAYYLPPMEAVSSIQFLRGAAGLQFGPQVGGLVNYVLKDAPEKPFEMTVSQTGGSFGLYNAYVSAGGTVGKWQYFAFGQYRTIDGWRANSDQKQFSGFGKVSYAASPKLKISAEYTLLRNHIHMPGGLTDSLFEQNPRQSLLARNWLQSPWNIVSANIDYKVSEQTSLSFKSTVQFAERDLIWRNEDYWFPDNYLPDSIGADRELEKEYFNSVTNELRVLTNYEIGGRGQTIAYGVREASSLLRRYEGGTGSTGSDLNLDLQPGGSYETAINFRSQNIALFAENIFHVGDKLSITPGGRLEYLSTRAYGYTEDKADYHQTNQRMFVLGGIGAQYELNKRVNVYGNFSQSYRPVTFSDLTPFASTAVVDKDLKDTKADNADLGIRGMVKGVFNFDASLFYLYNYNGIGKVDRGTEILITNTGSSAHTGIETYGELNLSKLFFHSNKYGKLSLYNSFAYINAIYTSGDVDGVNLKGKQVEYAPHVIERAGINYWIKGFECNAQYTYQSQSFGDATNGPDNGSGETGVIPSYWLLDVSTAYKWNRYKVSFGVNNVTDQKYFTLRTSEYPGPGIIPSIGRMIYGGLAVTF